jgi:hypothetical protein
MNYRPARQSAKTTKTTTAFKKGGLGVRIIGKKVNKG